MTLENGDDEDEDEFSIITPPDPKVVHPPAPEQGLPWQSIFIFNPNQPVPPVLASRFFPPPPWPENLEGENLTILPVVGPILALTEEQMETPPGFGTFFGSIMHGMRDPHRRERRLQAREAERSEERREERREEEREERRERRSRRRRNGDREGWAEGSGAAE